MNDKELRPCPFCGEIPKSWISESGKTAVDCNTPTCLMYNEGGVYAEYWNTRPLEDALKAERDDYKGERDAYMKSYEEVCAERDALQDEIVNLQYKNSVLKDYEELYHRRGDINGNLVRERNAMEYERDALATKLEAACQGLIDIYVADGGLGMSEYAEDTLKKIGMEHKLNGLRPGDAK